MMESIDIKNHMRNQLRFLWYVAVAGPGIWSLAPACGASLETVMPAQSAVQNDMDIVKARLIAAQIPTDPAALQTLADSAAKARDTLGADGKWPGLDYQDPGGSDWAPSRHVENVLLMTRAFATPGQPLYGDAALRKTIDFGLDTYFQGNYRSANWWYNDIGVPSKIGVILLLLENSLSSRQKEQGLAILKSSADDKPMRGSSGANLSWLARVQLMRGLVQPSPELVADCFDTVWSEVKISPQKKDGIQADYSFHQHGPLIYSGGYATSFINDVTSFLAYARGTRFAMPVEKQKILVNFLLDGQDWMAWGGAFDASTRGRNISRQGGGTPSPWREIGNRLARETDLRRAELLELARRQEPDGKKLIGNRSFWNSDFMTHHREGYYTSVRTHSTRTRNTDGASKGGGPINREGRLSHHVADGATYILRRGDEYNEAYPVWNWTLVPGTTAEQVAALDQDHIASLGATSFVGGVSDGMYGAAAMDLQRKTLRAKKAWFYFDNEFVALGAGISSTSANAVCTSVNQSLLHGEVRIANQPAPLVAGQHNPTGARWVLHDETGYIFPPASKLHLSNQTRSGRWSDIGSGSDALVSREVFSLYLDHGVQPEGANYEYIVVPNTTTQDLNARIARSPVEILSNTPDLQAVRHQGLKIFQAIFYKPGSLTGSLSSGAGWNLKVDVPCLVMLREMLEGVEITVSNPENKPLAVNIEIDQKLTGEGASTLGNLTTLHFDLPDGLLAGSSLVRIFKRN